MFNSKYFHSAAYKVDIYWESKHSICFYWLDKKWHARHLLFLMYTQTKLTVIFKQCNVVCVRVKGFCVYVYLFFIDQVNVKNIFFINCIE